MKITRKIKRSVTALLDPCKSSKNFMIVQCSGMGKYRYPVMDEVPSGYYVSRIMKVKDCHTNAGFPAIEVFYKLSPLTECFQRANGIFPQGKKRTFYHIRQKYPKNSTYYDEFTDKMAEALFLKRKANLNLAEVVGIYEKISLTYPHQNSLGRIDKRVRMFKEDLIQERNSEKTSHIIFSNDDYSDEDDDGYVG